MNLIRTLKESGQWSSPGWDDHRHTGGGAGYGRMFAVPGWGVVDVFTMANEPISRLPRRDVGVPVRGKGVAPHLSFSQMWVTSHPRVISLPMEQ